MPVLSRPRLNEYCTTSSVTRRERANHKGSRRRTYPPRGPAGSGAAIFTLLLRLGGSALTGGVEVEALPFHDHVGIVGMLVALFVHA